MVRASDQCRPSEAAQARRHHLADMQTTLLKGWKIDPRRWPLLRAAIGHALDFSTWQSLTGRQGLRHNQAVALATELLAAQTRPAAHPNAR